jgi:hypothetical protein
MNVEIRIPISPTPHFFRQVHYICRSFSERGGVAADARFLISVGDDCEPYDLHALNPWSLERVRWSWVDRDLFRRFSYHATTLDRYTNPTEADVVLFLDADTMLVRDVDDVFQSIVAQQAVAGVIAHVPPFARERSNIDWQTVFAAMGRRLPPARFQHTGWGSMLADPRHRFAPAYYNYGAVFFPGSAFAEVAARIGDCLDATLAAPVYPGFYSQLALTLAIYDADLPHVSLDLRYNYPNEEWADGLHAGELEDVRIIHYLREHVLGTRRETWGTDAAFRAFLDRRDLSGSNEVLRKTVAALDASRESIPTDSTHAIDRP